MEKHRKKEKSKPEIVISEINWLNRWVERHKAAARFLVRLIIAGLTSLVYFFRRKEKEIEHEMKMEKNEE